MLINPTGAGLRMDSSGSGRFFSPRGNRKHHGIDLLCTPGQVIKAPISGKMIKSFPYQGDTVYTGCRITSEMYMLKLFYLTPYEDLLGDIVEQGQDIGLAQDISVKYGNGMKSHIHIGLWRLDPETLLNPEHYIELKQIEMLRDKGY